MNRRDFALLAASLLAAPQALAAPAPARPVLKPPRLREGALVGLIAPCGVTNDAGIERAFRSLESLGFRVKPGKNLRAAYGGYAGTVAERLEDLHAAFGDPEVKAVWVARGGSGAIGLLDGIDYALVRRNPKIFMGFSDATALHLALYAKAGLVSFHGPTGGSNYSAYTTGQMQAVLMDAKPRHRFEGAVENELKASDQPAFAPRTFREGVAEGRLVGGNLSLVSALVGTPYLPPLRNQLLFLEEISEAPYRVDRMLTQLALGAGLRSVAGAMLGVFQKCVPTDSDPSLTLMQVLENQFAAQRFPSGYGYSVGHIPQQFTVPVGIRARLDTRDRSLTLLESAVS